MFGKFWALSYARRYLRISTRRFELLIGVVEKLFTSKKYRIGIINHKTFNISKVLNKDFDADTFLHIL